MVVSTHWNMIHTQKGIIHATICMKLKNITFKEDRHKRPHILYEANLQRQEID